MLRSGALTPEMTRVAVTYKETMAVSSEVSCGVALKSPTEAFTAQGGARIGGELRIR
jgi:hypothetical protein